MDTLSEAAAALLPTKLLLRALVALVALVFGLLLARLAGRLAAWTVRRVRLDVLAERAGVSRLLYSVGIHRGFPEVVDWGVWGTCSLVVLALLAEAGGLPGVAEGIARVVEYMPRVLASAVILLAGLVGADVLRSLVRRIASRKEAVESPGLVAQAVYYSAVVVSFSMAAEQLGIDTALIDSLISLAFGAAVGGAALAFALSARPVLRHALARHYAQRMFKKGDRLRLGDREFVLERFGPVTAWLRTSDGLVSLPAGELLDQPVLLYPGFAGPGRESKTS